MNNIDRRIVEMRFDNAQFERGISQSQRSLTAFERSIDSLKGISARALEASTSPVKVALQGVEQGLSAFQVASMRIISNITDTIYSKVTGVMNAVSSKVVQGGINRAMNIENAHFMLQGLIDDENEVQAIMQDAKDSVDGTAYAYDSAAKAASQFAATGMRAGEEMQTALKGITGIAATTNSNYEDISRIFTTVAGNGRLMGDQLLQLSSRGLNVAASLSKYFQDVSNGSVKASDTVSKSIKKLVKKYGSNEAAIRDMVSKGKISFDVFSEAMGTTFGEHAKKANETFNGALSNIGAALARTGEMFVAPLIEQNGVLVKLFNAIRIKVNEINAALKPLSVIITDKLKDAIDTIRDKIESINLDLIINKIKHIWDVVKILFGGFKNIGTGIKSVLNPILTTFRDFWFSMGYGVGNLRDLANKFLNFTSTLKLTTKQQENVKKITKNVLTVVKNALVKIKTTIKDLYPYVKKILQSVYDSIVVLVRKLKELQILDKIRNTVDKIIKTVENGINKAKKWIDSLSEFTSSFRKNSEAVDQWGTKIDTVNEKSEKISKTLAKTKEAFGSIFGWLGEQANSFFKLLNTIFTKVIDLFTGVSNSTYSFKENLGRINIFEVLNDWISQIDFTKLPEFLSNFKDGVYSLGRELNKIIQSMGYKDFKDFIEGGVLLLLGYQVSECAASIADFNDVASFGLMSVFSNVNAMTNELDNSVDSVINSMNKLFSTKNNASGNILKSTMLSRNLIGLATAVAIFAGSLFILSNVKPEALVITLGALSAVLFELASAVKWLTGMSAKNAKNNWWKSLLPKINLSLSMAATALSLAFSLSMLAGAIRLLAGADTEKAGYALLMLSAALWEFVIALKIVDKMDVGFLTKSKIKSFTTMAKALLIMAAAIALLSLADTKKAAGSLFFLSTALWEMVGVLVVLKKMKVSLITASAVKGFKKIATSLLILSAALFLLSKADPVGLCDALSALSKMLIYMTLVLVGLSKAGVGFSIQFVANAFMTLAAALAILAIVVAGLSKLDDTDLIKGVTTIIVMLGSLLGAMALLKKINPSIKSVLLLSVVTGNLYAIAKSLESLSQINIKQLVASVGSLAFILLTLMAVTEKLNGKGSIIGAISLTVLAGALLIISKALKEVGQMSVKEIIKGILALGIAIAGLAFASSILGASAAGLALFGGALLAIGAGLTAIGFGITLIGSGLTAVNAAMAAHAAQMLANAKAIIETIKIYIVGIADIIWNSMESLTRIVVGLVVSICDGIRQALPVIVETLLELIDKLLEMLVKYAPSIIDNLLQLIIIIINGLAKRTPELVDALANFFSSLWGSLKSALDKSGGKELIKALEVFAILSGVVAILAVDAMLMPLALVGLAGMTLIIVGFVGLLAMLGAISSIPGLNWFVSNGAEMMGLIGEAIGKFIGGFEKGKMSSFPKMCEDIQNGLNKLCIDNEQVEGLKNLVITMGLITKNNFLEGMTRWITGKNSYNEFGKAIKSFGESFSEFYESIKNIDDVEKVKNVCEAIKVLAEAASQVPDGGESLKSFFFGDHDISEFGRKLVSFGPHLKEFCDIVKDIDTSGVQSAADALVAMSDAAVHIPDKGESLKSFFFGDHDIGDFGRKLASFGPHLKEFCNSVKGIDTSGVSASATALKDIAVAAQNIPDSGESLKSFILGNHDISEFGRKLASFGGYFKQFIDEVSGTGVEAVTSATNCFQVMVEAAKSLHDNYSFFEKWGSGKHSDFVTFGKHLAKFAPYFKEFVSNLGDFSSEKATAAAEITKKFADIVISLSTIPEVGGTNLTSLGLQLENIGTSMNSFAVIVSGIETEHVEKAIKTLKDLVSIAKDISSIDSGKLDAFVTSMASMGTRGVQGIIDAMRVSESTVPEAIQNAVDEYVKEIETQITRVDTLIENNVRNGLQQWTFKNIAKQNVLGGLLAGLKDSGQLNSIKVASGNAGKVASNNTKNSMSKSTGRNIAVDFINGLIIGLNSSASRNALGRTATFVGSTILTSIRNRLDSHSPSREAIKIGGDVDTGLAIGMDQFSNVVATSAKNVGDTTLNSMRDSIDRINENLMSDDFRPVISPVLDLSDVSAKAGDINGMFSDKQFKMATEINGMMNSYAEANRLARSINLDDGRMVEAITGLRKDVNTMGMQMSNLQVVMDSGALVGQIASPMDDALGSRALRNWREREA